MKRFSSYDYELLGDYWRDRFNPKDFIKVMAHVQSVLSSRLDMVLLSTFDIVDIDEHAVGAVRTWIPLFDDTGRIESYDETDADYPWHYEIGTKYLFIDAIYDSHVDPEITLQHDIDFIVEDGVLKSVKQIPSDRILYISKCRIATYRIAEEIGNLLDYVRLDSVKYRDSIAPVLAPFFNGPTYINLTAILNIVVGLPVVKYGNETVISIEDGVIKTNRYTYDIGTAHCTVSIGDVLYRFQPLSDAIEIVTYRTHGKWWESRAVALFSKYLVSLASNVQAFTSVERNLMMETFLYDVVANIRMNMNSAIAAEFLANQDVLSLFYDSLATRTDIILTQAYTVESWDNKYNKNVNSADYDGPHVSVGEDIEDGKISVPDSDPLHTALSLGSRYGLVDYKSPEYIYSPALCYPVLYNSPSVAVPEDNTPDPGDDPLVFKVDNYYWHLQDGYEDSDREVPNKDYTNIWKYSKVNQKTKRQITNLEEFWKDKPNTVPMFEPYISRVYLRLYTPDNKTINDYWHNDTYYEPLERNIISNELTPTFDTDISLKFRGDGTATTGLFSDIDDAGSINDSMLSVDAMYKAISPTSVFTVKELATWTSSQALKGVSGTTDEELVNQVVRVSSGMMSAYYNDTSTLTMVNPMYVGEIAKNIVGTLLYDTPGTSAVELQYTTEGLEEDAESDNRTWTTVPSIINNVKGNIYFRIKFISSTYSRPTARRLIVDISVYQG